MHVAGLAIAGLLVALAPGTATAQSGLRLGEPAEPSTIDLGAPAPGPVAPGTTGTAAPTAPTRPLATRPVPTAPADTGEPLPVPPRADAPPDSLAPGAGPGVGPAAGQGGGAEPVSRKAYGDWEVACAASGECAMAQIGEDAEGVPILEMVVRKLPEPLSVGDRTAVAVLDIVTPLGVVLVEGLGLSVDGSDPESAPFQICTEQGCLVREPIDEDLVQRFKRGSETTVSVVAANQGEVSSTLSLRGFTAGFGAL